MSWATSRSCSIRPTGSEMGRRLDPARSQAVLIGVGNYTHPELSDLPAVQANLADLRTRLITPGSGSFEADSCVLVLEPRYVGEVGAAVRTAARAATDVLLIYYTGHGVLDPRLNRLYLALADSDPDRVAWTALAFDTLREELLDSPAAVRILILDCCFSGLAFTAMSNPTTVVAGQFEVNGTYTITSSAANQPSFAPAGHRYTAFTAALLATIDTAAQHTLDSLFRGIDTYLTRNGHPRPQRRSINIAGDLVLFDNLETCRRQAASGDLDAMYKLAEFHYGRREHGEAEAWFRKAAAAGHTDAIYELGLRYGELAQNGGSAARSDIQEVESLLFELSGNPPEDAALGAIRQISDVLRHLHEAGASRILRDIAERLADAVPIDKATLVSHVLTDLWEVDAIQQVGRLLDRNPGVYVELGCADRLAVFLISLEEVSASPIIKKKADEQVDFVLARNAVGKVSLLDVSGTCELLGVLHRASATRHLIALAERAILELPLNSPSGGEWLLRTLLEVGAIDQFVTLAYRVARQLEVMGLYFVTSLLRTMERGGANDQVAIYLDRVVDTQPLEDPYQVQDLLMELHQKGDYGRIARLLARDPLPAAPPDHPHVRLLLEALLGFGDDANIDIQPELIALMLGMASDQGLLEYPLSFRKLLAFVKKRGTRTDLSVLLDMNPAGSVRVDKANIEYSRQLVDDLQRLEAFDQCSILESRLRDAASHTSEAGGASF
ncbi:caspase family protein [Nocardia amikacinitolerans]|uniref:caspase, EACC1-associated type n=1 Tax=Nocardia amikacinitolerans TaxID=756689 RepID=UPI0036C89E54